MLLITGGTGYVGGYVLEALEGKVPRSEIRVMARQGANLDKLRGLGYSTAVGSVTNLEQVHRAMQGVDKVIHLVAIIREVKKRGQTFDAVIGRGTENVAQAAREEGVKRFVYQSALGATNKSTGYFRNKLRGEAAVKGSGIPYVIFRPSFLIGAGGEFTTLLKQLTSLPIVPVIGPGNYPVQPIYVRDMARYMVQSLDDDRYLSHIFEVGGPETIEYNDMMRETMEARGKKGVLFHAPLFLVKPAVPLIEAVAPKLLTREQLTMLLEGSHTSDVRVRELGGFEMMPFPKAIKIALTTPPPATYVRAKRR
jgi:NADH dehydrogenase